MPTYAEQVSAAFFGSNPERFGDAHATTLELTALRELYNATGKDRGITINSIIKNGYPQSDEITPEDLGLAGASHACGVASHLAEERGPDGKKSTHESYTAKNRFDRFVSIHLPENLREAWEAPIAREEGFESPDIAYPDGVDTRYIYGVAKPSRYLPAQTMRHLEFARLGKLDAETQEVMQITGEPPDRFKIDWGALITTIENASDVVQLAGDIGAKIAEQLLDNGLSEKQVTAILKKSFDTSGVKKEHGDVPEAREVWKALGQSLARTPETGRLAIPLKISSAFDALLLPKAELVNPDGGPLKPIDGVFYVLGGEGRSESVVYTRLKTDPTTRGCWFEAIQVQEGGEHLGLVAYRDAIIASLNEGFNFRNDPGGLTPAGVHVWKKLLKVGVAEIVEEFQQTDHGIQGHYRVKSPAQLLEDL